MKKPTNILDGIYVVHNGNLYSIGDKVIVNKKIPNPTVYQIARFDSAYQIQIRQYHKDDKYALQTVDISMLHPYE